MKIYKIILSFIIVVGLCCGCNRGGGHEPAVAAEVTIHGLEEGRWVYFSVKDGATVGSSTFLSEEEDAEWAERADWDFAICGDYLKTNSGASGKGSGGIMRDSGHNFQTLKEAPAEGYLTDIMGGCQVSVKRGIANGRCCGKTRGSEKKYCGIGIFPLFL